MLNDPGDTGAYRIAIASIGLGLLVMFAGVCTIAAAGKPVPPELWYAGSAAAGILVGILIPFSLRVASPGSTDPDETELSGERIAAVMLLLAFGAAAASVGAVFDYLSLQMLGVAVGGVLFGLVIPSPSRSW